MCILAVDWGINKDEDCSSDPSAKSSCWRVFLTADQTERPIDMKSFRTGCLKAAGRAESIPAQTDSSTADRSCQNFMNIQLQLFTEDMLSDSNTDSLRRIVTSRENAIRQILNREVGIRWNLNKTLHLLTLAEKYINSTSESLFTWRQNVTFLCLTPRLPRFDFTSLIAIDNYEIWQGNF